MARTLEAAVAVDDRDRKPTRRCIGVTKRRCGEEIDPRSKRCSECRAEHKRLKKREHNGNYYLAHGDQLNEHRRKLRKRKKIIGLLQELFAAGGVPPMKPTGSWADQKDQTRAAVTDRGGKAGKEEAPCRVDLRSGQGGGRKTA